MYVNFIKNKEMYDMEKQHLAWHETLEIHELVAFQANGLMKLKKVLPEVTNQELKKIYQKAISG
ncbi:spore coat protein, partial [Pseudomonas sp. 2995-1]